MVLSVLGKQTELSRVDLEYAGVVIVIFDVIVFDVFERQQIIDGVLCAGRLIRISLRRKNVLYRVHEKHIEPLPFERYKKSYCQNQHDAHQYKSRYGEIRYEKQYDERDRR